MKLLYIKRRLFQSKVNITGLIVNGIVHHTPKATVIKQIRKEVSYISRAIGLNQVEINQMYYDSLAEYNTVSKKTYTTLRRIDRKFGKKEDYEENLRQRMSSVYNTVRKSYIQPNRLEKERNQIAYSAEHRIKHDAIYGRDGLIQDARSRADEGGYSPFFLASAHPNPAKDHAAWEGKMYFDADWENFIPDESTATRIRSYIKNRKLRTVQWVVGAPVYLITRPNCKHYLQNIPIDEVLHASPKTLLKRHKMYMADEEPITPAIRAYRAYYERYKTDLALNELIKSEDLAKDMEKDSRLLAKWRVAVNASGKHGTSRTR